jgi:sulfite exporter TauE/SafE
VSIALGGVLLVGVAVSWRWERWLPVARLVNPLKAGMAPLLRQPSLFGLATLGLLNGLLPCGLVYVACAGATATGHGVSGAAYMAAFGAGTVPLMLAISLSGRLVPSPVRRKLRRLVPISIAAVAALLVLRGLALGIPYLSPDLSAGHCAWCDRH